MSESTFLHWNSEKGIIEKINSETDETRFKQISVNENPDIDDEVVTLDYYNIFELVLENYPEKMSEIDDLIQDRRNEIEQYILQRKNELNDLINNRVKDYNISFIGSCNGTGIFSDFNDININVDIIDETGSESSFVSDKKINISIGHVNYHSIEINWQSIDTYNKYGVFRNGQLLEIVQDTSYIFNNLDSEVQYELGVAVYHESINSFGYVTNIREMTEEFSLLPYPDNFEIDDINYDSILLIWDNVDDAKRYEIQNIITGQLYYSSNNTLLIDNLNDKTLYKFRISAIDNNDNSGIYSPIIEAITPEHIIDECLIPTDEENTIFFNGSGCYLYFKNILNVDEYQISINDNIINGFVIDTVNLSEKIFRIDLTRYFDYYEVKDVSIIPIIEGELLEDYKRTDEMYFGPRKPILHPDMNDIDLISSYFKVKWFNNIKDDFYKIVYTIYGKDHDNNNLIRTYETNSVFSNINSYDLYFEDADFSQMNSCKIKLIASWRNSERSSSEINSIFGGEE